MYQINQQVASKRHLTMYDLPSENPEDLGLPDIFHDLQPELLRWTFKPTNYQESEIFTGSDLNLYYSEANPNWYKRPDWFVVLGTPYLYQNKDLRLSYVIWDEKITPFLVVELISKGTEKEDLGTVLRDASQPPGKWEVYEQILKVPYYLVFDRYRNYRLRIFQLIEGKYQEIESPESRIWWEELQLGIGIWEGSYDQVNSKWLRCYDAQGNWIKTPEERAEQERLRADKAEQELARLKQLIQQSAIDLE